MEKIKEIMNKENLEWFLITKNNKQEVSTEGKGDIFSMLTCGAMSLMLKHEKGRSLDKLAQANFIKAFGTKLKDCIEKLEDYTNGK